MATLLMTPMATFLSRPFFTSSLHCTATGRCLRMAKGVASGSMFSLQGGTLSITGSLCLSQVLKA